MSRIRYNIPQRDARGLLERASSKPAKMVDDKSAGNYSGEKRRERMAGESKKLQEGGQSFGQELPEGMADALIRAKYLPTDGRVLGGAGVLAAAALAGGIANAYTDQSNQGYSTDPLAVAGRTLQNTGALLPNMGQDPLAAARRSVQDQRRALGSDAVLEAIVFDQVNAEEQAKQQAFDIDYQAMVDDRTAYYMSQPRQTSQGLVDPDVQWAVSRAQEDINQHLRIQGVL